MAWKGREGRGRGGSQVPGKMREAGGRERGKMMKEPWVIVWSVDHSSNGMIEDHMGKQAGTGCCNRLGKDPVVIVGE